MAHPGMSDPTPFADEDLLAAGLIHELRQPLTGAKAALALLSRELGAQATALEAFELLGGQVRRLEEILETFGGLLARPEARGVPFALEPVVRRTLDLLAFRLRPLGPRYAFAPAPELPLARGSPRAVVHALSNLVGNALDALEGSPAGRLEVRLLGPLAPGAPIELRVSDGGPGIPADLAPRIFEPGVTSKTGGRGSGLGLPLARRLMRGSGGEVVLVPPGEARRRSWAAAELAVTVPTAGEAP